MKYIKLFENFQEKKPISDKDWNEFSKVNKRFNEKIWLKRFLFDNGDGTFDYDIPNNSKYHLIIDGKKNPLLNNITSLKEVIPLVIKNISYNFIIKYMDNLKSFEYSPKFITDGNFVCVKCPEINSFEYSPVTNGMTINSLDGIYDLNIKNIKDGGTLTCINCNNVSNLKGLSNNIDILELEKCNKFNSFIGIPPQIKKISKLEINLPSLLVFKYLENIEIDFCRGNNTFSLLSDIGLNNKDGYIEEYSKEGVQNYLNSEQFSAPVWFEALAYVGARDPEAYAQVCKDFPNETTFTPEQVEEYLNSPLIDRKSTEEDWKVVKDILSRTKKYDHSEYRDSKLDSEWKEVF